MKCISLPSGGFCSLPKGCFAALGCFDGLHAGHRELLRESAALARRKGVPFAVWSPKGAKNAATLTDPDVRNARLHVLGADYRVEEDFAKIRDLTPEVFFEEYLIGKYGFSGLSCGENFTFGKGGAGTPGDLAALCEKRGVSLFVKESVTMNGRVVSDSLVRERLQKGDARGARDLLCDPYGFSARSLPGRQIGRTLGFPTINLPLPEGFLLPDGVYRAGLIFSGKMSKDARMKTKIEHAAVANVGVHPTFEKAEKPLCEVHLLIAPDSVPKEKLRVVFYDRLRDEIAFSSPEALARQLKTDAENAKNMFEKEGWRLN